MSSSAPSAHHEHSAHQEHAEHQAQAGHHEHAGHTTPDQHASHGAHAGHAGAGTLPGGLQISEDGYTLALEATALPAGDSELRFRILGPDAQPVTGFDPIHDRRLHLIIARRDLTGFWHLHPVEDGQGAWSVRISLPEAGAYRVFTDIAPTALGRTLTLGSDLEVAGWYEPRPVPAPAPSFAVDGYEVALKGQLAAGEPRAVELVVSKDGKPVTDLQPYLAAYGHLVVLRAGDLAYVHVHPDGSPGDGVTPAGPGVAFHAQVPGPGTYRLFLDFKHEDTVRTAEFTAVAD